MGELAGEMIPTQTQVFGPTIVQHSVDALLSRPEAEHAARELVRTHRYQLQWHEPTKSETAWLVEALDAEGNVIDSAMTDDPEEGLLELAHRLLPPTGG